MDEQTIKRLHEINAEKTPPELEPRIRNKVHDALGNKFMIVVRTVHNRDGWETAYMGEVWGPGCSMQEKVYFSDRCFGTKAVAADETALEFEAWSSDAMTN